jgi:hypothetical protein
MPAISFSVFREKILDGSKYQTIRKIRNNPIKTGDILYLWWKQRTSEREKLGEAKCNGVMQITIHTNCVTSGDQSITEPSVLERFAIADGFDSWSHMVEWFQNTHGLPFTGVLIKWGRLIDPDYESCHECDGSGHHEESIHMPCSNCLGSGQQPS